jgi:hypothetical protein
MQALLGYTSESRWIGRILATSPALAAHRPGQVLIADRQYYGAGFEAALASQQLRLLRPARKGESERPGSRLFKPLRQTIESINQTFKGQLDLERHDGHTPPESWCASCSASSLSPQRSGTTTTRAHRSTAP